MSKTLEQFAQMSVASVAIAGASALLSIAWYRVVAKGALDRDTILFIVKLSFGIGLTGMLIFCWTKYT